MSAMSPANTVGANDSTNIATSPAECIPAHNHMVDPLSTELSLRPLLDTGHQKQSQLPLVVVISRISLSTFGALGVCKELSHHSTS
jgi:hypothetical protein